MSSGDIGPQVWGQGQGHQSYPLSPRMTTFNSSFLRIILTGYGRQVRGGGEVLEAERERDR